MRWPRKRSSNTPPKSPAGQKDPAALRLARGLYATTINIHNPSERPARLTKKLALTYPPGSQRRGEIKRIGTDEFGPDEALETDCNDILRRVFGGTFPTPYFEGFVIIQSRTSLDVTAVYSTASLERTQGGLAHSSIDVEQIRERRRRADGNLPDLIPVPDPARGFCVRDGDKLRVTVRNQGSAPAGPSTTTLDFGAFGTQSQPTPALAAGASAVVIFTIPTNPNCFDPPTASSGSRSTPREWSPSRTRATTSPAVCAWVDSESAPVASQARRLGSR